MIDPADLQGGEASKAWVVYEATATSPKAKRLQAGDGRGAATCSRSRPRRAPRCTGSRPTATCPSVQPARPDTTAAGKTLQVLPNRSNKNDVRRVVYSVELAPGESIDDLEGEQMRSSAKRADPREAAAGARRRQLPRAQRRPTGIKGRYLISDSYDPGKTRQRRRELRQQLLSSRRRRDHDDPRRATSTRAAAT